MKTINENYFKNSYAKNLNDIEDIINSDEHVLWKGKPNKKAYILASIFSMFPFALIWLLFDGFFIGMIFTNLESMPKEVLIFIIIFFAFHLMPVWIWLSKIFTASREYKNLEYAFTNKRIIIKSGIIGIDFQNIYYSEIESVNLKVGLVDKIFKVGDIYIKGNSTSKVLFDISEPYFITQKLQEIVIDIKTDIEFPNNLRPKENDGYNTNYTKKQF